MKNYSKEDIFIVPLTSKTVSLFPGEFILKDWEKAGLNVATAIKRGIYTISKKLVIKCIGKLSASDSKGLEKSLREWLGLL